MSMWNRKKDEDIQVRPVSPAPQGLEPSPETIPMSTIPSRRVEEATLRAAAVVGKTVVVKGTITGKEDLVVDGRVDGDIELPENRLTVGVGGHVQGGVRAREIVVYGTVQGNLEASERVEIKKNARVLGDLRAQRPVIEDEAYFKGNVETIRVEQPKPAPVPQAKAAAASAAPVEPAQTTLPATETRRG